MIELSPGIELVALGALVLVLRLALGRRGALPTPAGAVVMAIGIFITAALQHMPALASLVAEPLSIALLVIWASMAVSYIDSALRGELATHSHPLIARFAIGTWIAATAVQAKVVEAEFHGATRVYELSLPSGALVRSEQPYETELHLGDSVYVSLTPGPHAVVADD